MKNILNKILLSAVVALAFAGSARAATVTLNNVVYSQRNNTASAAEYAGICLDPYKLNFDFGGDIGQYNLSRCPIECQTLPSAFTDACLHNTLWGVGQNTFTATASGKQTVGPGDRLVFTVIGGPKQPVDPTQPWNWWWTGTVLTLHVDVSCVSAGQDNQGAKFAVVGGLATQDDPPNPFAGNLPFLMLTKQSQNGLGSIEGAIPVDSTACTFANAQAVTYATFGIPGTDNLFDLLTPIMSGNISIKK